MKISSISLLKWMGEDKDPIILGQAFDLTHFGYFQRPSIKEMITFVSRTIVKRTRLDQRQTVQHEDYYCHVHLISGTNLAAILIADVEYPGRAAFSVLASILEELHKIPEAHGNLNQNDNTLHFGDNICEIAIMNYQDPLKADKLAKIQKDLDETKVVLHKTIEGVLERGEKLDALVARSNDLSMASQMFYKQARKANSCCSYF